MKTPQPPVPPFEADTARSMLLRAASAAADYLESVERYPVLPAIAPGEVMASLPESPPHEPEPFERILSDYQELIEPALTHWNHPGFLGYFAITGSPPGVAAETLSAALNVNAMLWRTSPAATELEVRVCDWLRQMMDLPSAFRGHINDTASISTLIALGAARERAFPEARRGGLQSVAGQPVVYASEQAHSSVDKAVLTLGIGLDGLTRIPTDDAFRLDPDALASAIEADLDAERRPMAVVATAGTTSTTSVDPLVEIAGICRRHELWLHVDAAYGGSAAICPERRQGPLAGLEQADSLVVNPHKWMFVPVDCSVLFTRGYGALRDAFSVVPEYLRTDDDPSVPQLMDLGVQLGRRFRALKLWMVIRSFGVEGLRRHIDTHCALAAELAEWVEADPGFELAAPVPFSVVCLRAVLEEATVDHENRFHRALLDRINRRGEVFLSSTELDGRVVLRVAIGNLGTGREHVELAWRLLREETAALREEEGT